MITKMIWPAKSFNMPGTAVRDYTRPDRRSLIELLQIIPSLYPRGREWLENRLDEVELGRASCAIAFRNGAIGGALIDVSKGRRTRKISTLFVSDQYSGQGMGSNLFENYRMRWLKAGIEKFYVTVASERVNKIEPFLLTRNFELVAIEKNRYGPERDEMVYSATLS
jgi:N-acetylglutamate synthase-like GNAT family acetyltransferase